MDWVDWYDGAESRLRTANSTILRTAYVLISLVVMPLLAFGLAQSPRMPISAWMSVAAISSLIFIVAAQPLARKARSWLVPIQSRLSPGEKLSALFMFLKKQGIPSSLQLAFYPWLVANVVIAIAAFNLSRTSDGIVAAVAATIALGFGATAVLLVAAYVFPGFVIASISAFFASILARHYSLRPRQADAVPVLKAMKDEAKRIGVGRSWKDLHAARQVTQHVDRAGSLLGPLLTTVACVVLGVWLFTTQQAFAPSMIETAAIAAIAGAITGIFLFLETIAMVAFDTTPRLLGEFKQGAQWGVFSESTLREAYDMLEHYRSLCLYFPGSADDFVASFVSALSEPSGSAPHESLG